MSIAVERPVVSDAAELEQYRALSSAAVASVVVGLLSVLSAVSWILGLIPAFGILLGLHALWRIRRFPEELTGRGVALGGITLSLLFWAIGWGWQGYVYATEVPDGYMRLSYATLQPSAPGELFPASARELDGQQVFIKGYVYPGSQRTGIQQFILCRDNGDCCFGGEPKLTDMIQVTLKAPLRLNYATRAFRVAGTFRVEPAQAMHGLGGVVYHLEADYLQ